MDLNEKRVLVTGGNGFLGNFVVDELKKKKVECISTPTKGEYDLLERNDVYKMLKQESPEVIIHLAAKVGGIEACKKYPASFFYENMAMGLNLFEAAKDHKIEKFVAIGSVCAYPKFAPIPFKEQDLWSGYPEETNAPYGLAKKMLLVEAQSYREQYGLNAIYLLPVNLYGPGDNFNPESSHVIPALIKKFIDAKEQNKKEVVIWGNGSPTREFLYVEDCAMGIVLATEKYDKSEPVNLGSGMEISINNLAELIKKLTDFEGKLVWDTTKPNGQPRRLFDNSKAKKEFGFIARIGFEKGLKKTIDWYLKNR